MEKRYEYITPQDYEIADKNGINRKMLNKRVHELGWDIDRAITTPKIVRRTGWTEWKDIALSNGVNYDCFKNRVKRYGFTQEQAAMTPKMTKEEIAKNSNRKYPQQYLDLALKNGIPKSTFYKRVKDLGWSLIQAATTPKISSADIDHSKFGNLDLIYKNKKLDKDGSL